MAQKKKIGGGGGIHYLKKPGGTYKVDELIGWIWCYLMIREQLFIAGSELFIYFYLLYFRKGMLENFHGIYLGGGEVYIAFFFKPSMGHV